MKYAALITVLVLGSTVANAAAIIETTGQVSQSLNSASNGSFSEVDLPAFNQGLGTLTAVNIAISASVRASVVDHDASAPQAPSFVDAKVLLSFLSSSPIAFPTQVIPVTSNGISADVSAGFVGNFTPSDITDFATRYNFFIPEPDVFIQSLAGPDTESDTFIDFDVTEAFTYSPVPEPTSLALVATGLSLLGFLRIAASRQKGGSDAG